VRGGLEEVRGKLEAAMECGDWPGTLLLILILLGGNSGAPNSMDSYQYDEAEYDDYDNDYGDQGEEMEEVPVLSLHQPRIVVGSQTIRVEEGEAITLPCTVDKLMSEVQVLWSRVDSGRTMIAMGETLLGEYGARASLATTEQGSNLTIGQSVLKDSGGYRCELALGEGRPGIEHTVIVTAPEDPLSVAVPGSEIVTARAGDDVTLSCTAQGSPTPLLAWTRPGHLMAGGQTAVSGHSVTLASVSLSDAGVYVCTATNQHSSPVSRRIEVEVELEPRVELEEVFLHTQGGEGV